MREFRVPTHGTEVAVWEEGAGHPILILHGLGLDHLGISAEVEDLFDSGSGWRRLYVDLPGAGSSPGADHLASADALLEVIESIVDALIGKGRFALVGQSYGGYLALGALTRFCERVSGVALLVPVIEPNREERVLPAAVKVRQDPAAMSLLPSDFLEALGDLVVDETPELASSLKQFWLPSIAASDEEFNGRLQAHGYSFTAIDPMEGSFPGPSLVLCGRHDAVVGYEQAMAAFPRFQRGTLVVLDGAGHLAQLEKQATTRALMLDWLERVGREEGL